MSKPNPAVPWTLAGSRAEGTEGNFMKKCLLVMAIMVTGVTLGVRQAAAQGPAGAGATAAVASSSESSHSYNPIHWLKKEPKKTGDSQDANSDQTKKLNDRLQAQGIVAANSNVKDLCVDFKELADCLAALHASHSLGLDFACVRANATGIKTGVDTSSCRMADTDKPLNLVKTIKLLKPDANAKSVAKDAEILAKEDVRETGA
ncbi:MAG TPA: hypothetical protein VLV88_03485 [Terriglobales bacterium]|nr:hypothetical protein [Terriglobales bacterium]